jgi:hypothetical protein
MDGTEVDSLLESLRARPGNEEALQIMETTLRRGTALAFVGAGASLPLYPTVRRFIEEMLAYANSLERIDGARREYLASKVAEDQASVLAEVRKALGESGFATFIKLMFSRESIDGRGYSPTHFALVNLPFRGFLTTNFDSGLERAQQRLHPDVDVVVADWRSDAVEAWADRLPSPDSSIRPVLHLHGFAEEPQGIIFENASYAATGKDEPMRRLWRDLLLNHDLIFVGTSFQDVWLRSLAKEVRGANPTRVRHVLIWVRSDERAEEDARFFRDNFGIAPLICPDGQTVTDLLTALAIQLGVTPAAGVSAPGSSASSATPTGFSPAAPSLPTAPPSVPPPAAPSPSRHYTEGHILADKPAIEDSLGYTPYVEALAGFIRDERTGMPLTISVEGEWGAGKSSFLLQVERKLRIPDGDTVRGHLPMRTVWFNPWRHDAGVALWAAFAIAFERQMQRDLEGKWAWLKKRFHLLQRRFSVEQHWQRLVRETLTIFAWFVAITAAVVLLLMLVEPRDFARSNKLDVLFKGVVKSVPFGFVAAVFAFGVQFKKFLGNPLQADLKDLFKEPNYAEQVAGIERFQEDFARLVEVYGPRSGDKPERIVVFIDDLDRCEVPKAAELLQSLQLLMSPSDPASNEAIHQPQLVFILGIDREKVAAGIAAKHEKLWPYLTALNPKTGAPDPVAGLREAVSFGLSYLEKFIDVTLRLPSLHAASLHRYLGKLCENAGALAEPAGPDFAFPDRYAETAEKPSAAATVPRTAEDTGGLAGSAPSITPSAEQLAAEAKAPAAATRKVEEKLRETNLIHDCALMAAPLLRNNPRRIKQFVNLFRLRARLLPLTAGTTASSAGKFLTLQQMGKLIAIELAHPLLLDDWKRDTELFPKLNKHYVTGSTTPLAGVSETWSKDVQLRELILAKPLTVTKDDRFEWDLSFADLARFQAIAPLAKGKPAPEDPAAPTWVAETAVPPVVHESSPPVPA